MHYVYSSPFYEALSFLRLPYGFVMQFDKKIQVLGELLWCLYSTCSGVDEFKREHDMKKKPSIASSFKFSIRKRQQCEIESVQYDEGDVD